MQAGQHHLIVRQVLEVGFVGEESDGLALQRDLMTLCQHRLVPALSEVFDRSVSADRHWVIDKLDIDLGQLPGTNIEERLLHALTRAVEQTLHERSPLADAASPSGRRGDDVHLHQAVLHFLQTGLLPWWFRPTTGKTLEQLLRECWQQATSVESWPQALSRLIRPALTAPVVRKRLARQFSLDVLDILIEDLSPSVARALKSVRSRRGSRDFSMTVQDVFSESLYEIAFFLAQRGNEVSPADLLRETLRTLPQEVALQQSQWIDAETRDVIATMPRPVSPGRETHAVPEAVVAPGAARHRPSHANVDLEQGVAIECAGIVLLHPFLPRLFETLDIARDDRLQQPERALALLHFLATGHPRAPEYDLALAKLLCAVPLNTPVSAHIELTAAELDEANALLQAVIGHWDALGETTLDGLRGSFLVRPGRLSWRQDDALLQVEARGYDLLLDRLPWGIGTIRLPWMNHLLWVEWRF